MKNMETFKEMRENIERMIHQDVVPYNRKNLFLFL